MDALIFVHSLWRYVVLVLLVASIFFAFKGLLLNAPILIGERKIWIFAVVACHIQLLVGLILYFTRFQSYGSSREGSFWKYEHISTMLLAILLITLGRVFAKRAKTEKKKQLMVGVFFLIGLVLIFSMIPWPWSTIARTWI